MPPTQPGSGEIPVLTYLRPIREIDLASAESGIVAAIPVRPGDKVKEGAEILRLNTAVIEAQLLQAEAQAAQEGRLKAARAERDMARRRLEIIDDLAGRGSSNDAEREKATATLAVADGQFQAVEEEIAAKRYEASAIRAQLEQRILRSPISGVVTEITRDVGESVESRRAEIPDYLARIVDLSRLTARVHMPAELAGTLREGMTLELQLQNEEAPRATGRVEFVSPTVDAATGLSEVHLIFENGNGRLRSGVPGTLMVPAPLEAVPTGSR